MRVILLSGKAQSGKDTVASMFDNIIPDLYTVAFADGVKRLANQEFCWNGLKDDLGRALLQSIGELGREYNPEIWINKAINRIRLAVMYDYEYAIITDARYINEVEAIKKAFPCTTIRIERFGFDNKLTHKQKTHASETELDTYEFDYVIHNNDSLKALENEVTYIANMVMKSESN